jgi:hypothetical protein
MDLHKNARIMGPWSMHSGGAGSRPWSGIAVQRVVTDNGSAHRSRAFGRAGAAHAWLRHLPTCPYTSRTNDKAERFIQTALREQPYASSSERARLAAPPQPPSPCQHQTPPPQPLG